MKTSDLKGVPDSITREQYESLIEAAGFGNLYDIISLRFDYDGIRAVVCARDEKDRLIPTHDENGEPIAATHTIFIPVVD